jgi:nucleoside 2-deoxyribosyltransferase
MSKLVYLAGPIKGLSYEGSASWREYAKRELAKGGIVCLSPMRAKEFTKLHHELSEKLSESQLQIISDRGIATRDKWDVSRCDIVLSNLLGSEKISIGTMIEYGWASAFGKPIVTVIEERGEGKENIHEHAILRDLSGYRISTLESGLEIVRALFNY